MKPHFHVAFALFRLLSVVSEADAQPTGLGPRFVKGVDMHAMPDTRGELDDWAVVEPGDGGAFEVIKKFSALLVLLIIAAGAFVRSQHWIQRHQADALRRICFTWLLPAFLLRHIWLVQLDSQLYAVAAYSLPLHLLWFFMGLQSSTALVPQDRQMRGWTMLMCQGTMNSFLYPLLLHNPSFGEKSLACAVLWDLGGNMWICQFALFAIAAYFRPAAKHGDQIGDNGSVDVESAEDGDNFWEEGDLASKKAKSTAWGGLQALTENIPSDVLFDALKQPVLICCILGFTLNVAGAPLPAMLDTPLWVVGEPYKIALYFLVGYYGDHHLGPGDTHRMGAALLLRYCLSLVIIVITLTMLPLESLYRYTIALAVLSPSSSYLMHLVGEHGYGEGLLRLTVCAGFVSTLISTFGQNMLAVVFAGWLGPPSYEPPPPAF